MTWGGKGGEGKAQTNANHSQVCLNEKFVEIYGLGSEKPLDQKHSWTTISLAQVHPLHYSETCRNLWVPVGFKFSTVVLIM